MICTPRLVRKFENGNENIGHSTKYYLHYVDPKLCFSDPDPALALLYIQGSIFRSEKDIYSPGPLLKMIFFPPLATCRFLTPIVAFLP
jgi:hypothetical protein